MTHDTSSDLYRKHRPKAIEQIFGQTTAVATLRKWFDNQEAIPQCLLITGDSGVGKSQPHSSLVLTESGFVKMQHVVTGTRVYTVSGNLTTVVGVYPQGRLATAELALDDATTARASYDHIWRVAKGTSLEEAQTVDLTTQQIKDGLAEGVRFWIENAKPIQYQPCPVFVFPFVLGVCLAAAEAPPKSPDSSFEIMFPRHLSADGLLSLVSELDRVLYQCGSQLSCVKGRRYKVVSSDPHHSKAPQISAALCGLPGFSRERKNRHIPVKEYLNNTAIVRKALLNGLLIANVSYPDFSTFSGVLAEQVATLVRSLGGTCVLQQYGLHWRVENIDLPENAEEKKYREVVSVKESVDEVCQCIKVDDASEMYITDNFIPTHNTTIARIIADRLQASPPFGYQEINIGDSNGIDVVRDLNAALARPSIEGNDANRVFFLDEVGSMSKPAQDALLKPLESLLPHTYVFLATTNPEKLSSTLKNRCVSLPLSKLNGYELFDLATHICEVEQKTLTPAVIHALSDAALGSARNLLSLMQRIFTAEDEQSQLAMIQESGTVWLDNQEANTQAVELYKCVSGQLMLTDKDIVLRLGALLKITEPEGIRRAALKWIQNGFGWQKVPLSKLLAAADALRQPYYDDTATTLIYVDMIRAAHVFAS